MTQKRLAIAAFCSLLVLGGSALAQREPPENIDPAHHPNLAAAQRFIRDAFNKTIEAQKANEWDLAGHAQKAKELLDQADHELRLAANAANRNRR